MCICDELGCGLPRDNGWFVLESGIFAGYVRFLGCLLGGWIYWPLSWTISSLSGHL